MASMRIIAFTGKGGSGVTTVAAATAVAAAEAGRRTLALGLAPGLADALGVALTAEPAALTDRLSALEVSPARADAPDDFRDWLRDLLAWRDMEETLADDLAALPGLADLSRFLALQERAAGGQFDLIVVDCPPLGVTLDLLASLDAVARWLDRLFPPRQPTVFEPFLRAISAYTPTGDEVYEGGRGLLLRLAGLRDLLSDPEVSSLRIVLSADGEALPEIHGALASLALFGHAADAVVLSRLLPPEVSDPFFESWRHRQREAVRSLSESLAPIPVLTAPLQGSPPAGLAGLADLARALYPETDPVAVLHRPPSAGGLSQRDGRYLFSLDIPFARRDELAVEHVGKELVVHLGHRRRTIALAPELHALEPLSSTFDGATLVVTFGPGRPAENAGSEP